MRWGLEELHVRFDFLEQSLAASWSANLFAHRFLPVIMTLNDCRDLRTLFVGLFFAHGDFSTKTSQHRR